MKNIKSPLKIAHTTTIEGKVHVFARDDQGTRIMTPNEQLYYFEKRRARFAKVPRSKVDASEPLPIR